VPARLRSGRSAGVAVGLGAGAPWPAGALWPLGAVWPAGFDTGGAFAEGGLVALAPEDSGGLLAGADPSEEAEGGSVVGGGALVVGCAADTELGGPAATAGCCSEAGVDVGVTSTTGRGLAVRVGRATIVVSGEISGLCWRV
jgi:hypothetical protein